MKKLFTIFFCALILASSTGITFALHYCGKRLQDVAVFGEHKACCEGRNMPMGCCDEAEIAIDADDYQLSQHIANTGYVPELISEITFPILDFTFEFQNAGSNYLTGVDDSPPPPGPELIIVVQSFLI